MPALRNISDKSNISLDLICYLQSGAINGDSIGNQIQTPTKRMVFCAELPVTSSEFFSAGRIGIKPDLLLVTDIEEYDGEESLEYNDEPYNIYRNYPRSDGFIEIYCKGG